MFISHPSSFSARELSLETDVLPALSGLAHAFEAGIVVGAANEPVDRRDDDDNYLAGIWRQDLARGLLWTPHDGSLTSRYTRYVSPTWSWASVKGQVHFPSEGSDIASSLEFLKPCLELKADDHMGAIRAAKLSLRARIRRLDEQIKVKTERSSWYPLELRSDGNLVGRGALDFFSAKDRGDVTIDSVWMMECLFQKPWDIRDPPTLLLLRRLDGSANTYERLGVGRLDENRVGFFGGCELGELILV